MMMGGGRYSTRYMYEDEQINRWEIDSVDGVRWLDHEIMFESIPWCWTNQMLRHLPHSAWYHLPQIV